MRYIKYVSLCIFLLFVVGCSTPNLPQNSDEQATSALYERMFDAKEPNIAMMNLFFTQMPKGGDLHHHYSGSIYVETYLEWLKAKNWWIDTCTFKIVQSKEAQICKLVSVDELIADNRLYRKLLTLWSDKDFSNHTHEQLPPDSHFFNTFSYFSPIAGQYMHLGLQRIKQRAISENVSYVECMLSRVGINSEDYFSADVAQTLNTKLHQASTQEEVDALLESISETFLNSPIFKATIENFTHELASLHQGIDDVQFTMRYQTYASRLHEPLQVYAELFSGYRGALNSPLVVGVNIVGAENNTVALNDYTLHMRMFHYLKNKYPEVHRSLHAGELSLGMVEPKELLFHITQAREIAGAERIGHGVDLPYETNPTALLKELKTHASIEINFTSNEFILGVLGNAHPYTIYAAYGVPLVISTDDSGISRDNLSHAFVLLASRYHPSYETIKTYVYNSIDYSFLSTEDKARVRAGVDKRFVIFEREMSAFSRHFNSN